MVATCASGECSGIAGAEEWLVAGAGAVLERSLKLKYFDVSAA